jgi:hypothetical protein
MPGTRASQESDDKSLHRRLREACSLRREDARALCLWAWTTYGPSDIPKVTWLAPTGDSATVLDGPAPPHGWSGLTFRVLVHIDVIEPPLDEYDNVTPRNVDCRYKVIDGEHNTLDRCEPLPPQARR